MFQPVVTDSGTKNQVTNRFHQATVRETYKTSMVVRKLEAH